jgi:hypothetical protein
MNEDKKIVDLCGGTGAASRPYKEAGYDVRIITLPNDIRLIQPFSCYGVLASPPCTDLAGSGARWWQRKGPAALFDALAKVDACLRFVLLARPVFWVLENPVGRLIHYLGKPKMYFQPYEYGDPWSKKTCLWGEFNVPVKSPVEPTQKDKIWKMSPGPCRSRQRSITPPGFARAFFEANQ